MPEKINTVRFNKLMAEALDERCCAAATGTAPLATASATATPSGGGGGSGGSISTGAEHTKLKLSFREFTRVLGKIADGAYPRHGPAARVTQLLAAMGRSGALRAVEDVYVQVRRARKPLRANVPSMA